MKVFELKRQLFHIFLGLTFLVLLYYNIINAWHVFIGLLIGVVLSFISLKYHIPLISDLLAVFEREGAHPGKGMLCFFIGVLLAIQLFPRDVAFAAIIILTLGDSISHYIGRFHGKWRHPFSDIKLIEGSIAGFIVASIGALLFVSPLEAVVASFFAMAAEATEIEFHHKIVDDNILIPLVAGVVIILLRMWV